MSFFSTQTDKLNGKIATLKTITDKSLKKYEKKTSGINNLMDSILNVINQVGGYKDVIKSIEKILSEKLDEIEDVVKSAIKIAIKEIISCSVEPTIDYSFIENGISFELGKIDPISILSIDPLSESGTYAYFDNLAEINSSDFNVFVYSIIKNTLINESYSGGIWYKTDVENNEKVRKPLFRVSYKEYDQSTMKSNILNINIDGSFEGEKVSYFISEYLDSVKLFNSVQIISTIFDELLGTRIISLNKTIDQLLNEKKIQGIIENLINNIEDETDIVDDSYYTFSNDTYNKMLEDTENKRQGKFLYNKNTNKTVEVNRDLLLDNLNGLKVDNLTITEQTKILTDTIDNISKDLAENEYINNSDQFSLKRDIINFILTRLMTTMSMAILSPKIMFLFSMSNKIIGKEDEVDSIEFIKKNINIFKLIILKIREVIMNLLIDKIKELLSPMIKTMVKELAKEKLTIYKKQLLSIKNII